MTPSRAPFDLILQFFDNGPCNQSVSESWRKHLHRRPIYGCFTTLLIWLWNEWSFYWDFTPKCSRMLSRPPKGTSLAGNTRFVVQIVPIGQEMRPGCVTKNGKREKTHIFARTTLVALPHQSCHVGWGRGCIQPCQVSSKLVQGFGSLRGRNLNFPMLSAMAYIAGLGLPPNLWYT